MVKRMWKQTVKPDTTVQDYAGWCLRFTQSVFNAPVRYASAWQAWLNAPGRRTNSSYPRNVAVILWFSHWGTYQGVYRNWGHVAVRLPNGRILSSPVTGYGQRLFTSVQQLERELNSKYVGWSTGINGKIVVEEKMTNAEMKKLAKMVADEILNRPINSGGVKEGGKKTLAGVIRWTDHQWASVKRPLEWLQSMQDKIENKLK